MKKNNFNFVNLLWFILLILPLILWVVLTAKSGMPMTFTNVFENFGFSFNLSDTNILYNIFNTLFTNLGDYIPIFANDSGIVIYFIYICGLEVVRLVIDILLFIPRLCQKLINK